MGHSWWGGGLFAREDRLDLSHPSGEDGRARAPADGFAVPDWLEVRSSEYSGGTAPSTETMRLRRDGWSVEAWPGVGFGDTSLLSAHPGAGTLAAHRLLGGGARLEIRFRFIRLGGTFDEWRSASVARGGQRRELGRVDWADADGGDLLYATGGCLWRLPTADLLDGPALLVADLNGMAFVPVPAPPEALRWARPHGSGEG